jgi:hypothetical protein
MPCGRSDESSFREWELEDYLEAFPLNGKAGLDQAWWRLYGNGRRPTWDLIAHLQSGMNEEPGILLVEAKGHINELSEKDRKSAPNPDSSDSLDNDDQIRGNLADAERVLNRSHRTRAGRFVRACQEVCVCQHKLAASSSLE